MVLKSIVFNGLFKISIFKRVSIVLYSVHWYVYMFTLKS